MGGRAKVEFRPPGSHILLLESPIQVILQFQQNQTLNVSSGLIIWILIYAWFGTTTSFTQPIKKLVSLSEFVIHATLQHVSISTH